MPDDPISSGGSTSSSPAGSARRVVERLDEAECLELLGTEGLGRLVYNSRYGATALPVEYKVYEGSIVFRTAQDGKQYRNDHVHPGWSFGHRSLPLRFSR